jgi:hypothetical protein
MKPISGILWDIGLGELMNVEFADVVLPEHVLEDIPWTAGGTYFDVCGLAEM